MNWCQWSNENILLVRTKWGYCTEVWSMSFPSSISLMTLLLLNQIQWLAFSTVSCLFLITFAKSSSRLLKAISATNHQWIHNNQLWLRDYMHSSLPLRIHSTVTHNSHISLPAQNQCCLHVGPSTQWGRRYSSQSSANHYISGIGKKRSQPERSAETSHFPSNPLLFLVRWSFLYRLSYPTVMIWIACLLVFEVVFRSWLESIVLRYVRPSVRLSVCPSVPPSLDSKLGLSDPKSGLSRP